MPLWLNAANAVLVTSDYEGFGMAAIEALACEVPVLSTPVGIAPYALRGIDGCLCAPFDADAWAAAAQPHLAARRPPRRRRRPRRDRSRRRAMAERAIEAYRDGRSPARNRLSRHERGEQRVGESSSARSRRPSGG